MFFEILSYLLHISFSAFIESMPKIKVCFFESRISNKESIYLRIKNKILENSND